MHVTDAPFMPIASVLQHAAVLVAALRCCIGGGIGRGVLEVTGAIA